MPGCLTLNDVRCAHCKKLLFRGLLVEGTVEIKCRNCRNLTTVSASRFDERLCLVEGCPERVPHEPQR